MRSANYSTGYAVQSIPCNAYDIEPYSCVVVTVTMLTAYGSFDGPGPTVYDTPQ